MSSPSIRDRVTHYRGEDPEKLGARRLLWALRRCVDEEVADRTYSTAHKAKGREWSEVRLASDFNEGDRDDEEMLRLLYVANTRAQHVLDRTLVTIRPGPRSVPSGREQGSRSTTVRPESHEPKASPRKGSDPDTRRQSPQTNAAGATTSRKGKRWTTDEDSA